LSLRNKQIEVKKKKLRIVSHVLKTIFNHFGACENLVSPQDELDFDLEFFLFLLWLIL